MRGQPGLPEFVVRHRGTFSIAVNAAVIAVAYTLAFLLRFDLTIPENYRHTFVATLPVVIIVYYGSFQVFKLTRGFWRYVGIADVLNAARAALAGSVVFATYVFLIDRRNYPRSIFLLNVILLVALSIGVRLVVRLWRQGPADKDTGKRKRLLIIGAGDTGDALLREVRQSPRLNYQVVAFLDDAPAKQGAYINGVPVVGSVAHTPDVVGRFTIDEVIVATPSASGDEMRAIINHCRAAGRPFKVLPATWEVLAGSVSLGAAREVDINDLLRRPPVDLDIVGIGRFLHGKRVLVSGAAGSIGSEICRQVLRFSPASLIAIDHDENALFHLERSLAHHKDRRVAIHLADITDHLHTDALFGATKPQVIFHAAAHKHVPMIERNVVEGVRNNVIGTETLATLAGRHDAEAFVMISTDKAVNPTSVMGVTKRIAELLIRTMPYTTRYTAVRFGNVLGSQGSVVPIFKEQIAAGGPVTVTDPAMRRYFMTIPEAVELVIQASAMGQGDEIFMLDMGAPVRIVDLAHDLIRLSGLRPEVDIPITFTGVRPGEKLYEELYLEAEQADRTSHPKILVARQRDCDQLREQLRFSTILEDLRAAVEASDESWTRKLIGQMVPEYGSRAEAVVVPLSAGMA